MTEERSLAIFEGPRRQVLDLYERAEPSEMVKQTLLDYWELTSRMESVSFVVLAEQVYYFQEALWYWEDRRERTYQLWTESWPEFCLKYLLRSPSEISVLKRIWEIYVVECGFDVRDLIRAGKTKLAIARTIVESQSPDVEEDLLRMLFGRPHRCSACGEYVEFEDEPPEFCPHCGARFEGQEPASFSELLSYCQAFRMGHPVPGLEVEFSLVDPNTFRMLVIVTLGERAFELPAWEVNSSEIQIEVEGHPGLWEPYTLSPDDFLEMMRSLEKSLSR